MHVRPLVEITIRLDSVQRRVAHCLQFCRAWLRPSTVHWLVRQISSMHHVLAFSNVFPSGSQIHSDGSVDRRLVCGVPGLLQIREDLIP